VDIREAARLLGVDESATLDEVQHAYVRLVRHAHPDTMPGATDAERRAAAVRFDALVQAKRVLLERTPVIPITFEAPEPSVPHRRRRGVGASLAVIAVVVFLALIVVSLGDAFRFFATGPLLP
jgi:hypothetical protein